MILELTVDRFEEGTAILKTKNNNEIVWPSENLSPKTKVGSVLKFFIAEKGGKSSEGRKFAKDILNELLEIKNTG
ncbi:MAG: hypothetical protein ABH881_00545 [bacterium]